MAKDYYAILSLFKGASQDEIKKAYRTLSKKWHPDKNPNNQDEAKRKFQEISEAYQVLSNDGKRREYDDWSSFGGSFDFNIPKEYFRSSDELFKEFFGNKTMDEALDDFLNDPMFDDIKKEKNQVKIDIPVTSHRSNTSNRSTSSLASSSSSSREPERDDKKRRPSSSVWQPKFVLKVAAVLAVGYLIYLSWSKFKQPALTASS